jgi:hypothetical protein
MMGRQGRLVGQEATNVQLKNSPTTLNFVNAQLWTDTMNIFGSTRLGATGTGMTGQ